MEEMNAMAVLQKKKEAGNLPEETKRFEDPMAETTRSGDLEETVYFVRPKEGTRRFEKLTQGEKNYPVEKEKNLLETSEEGKSWFALLMAEMNLLVIQEAEDMNYLRVQKVEKR